MPVFTRTRDLELVRRLITAPAAWDAATDDAAPDPADFQPHDHAAVWYVVATDAGGLIGLYTLIPENAVCWQIHATRASGSRALSALSGASRWIFERTACRRIVASIPATNRIAIRHARRAGFVEYGRNPRSFLKRGELRDQILLGISPDIPKENRLCHRQ